MNKSTFIPILFILFVFISGIRVIRPTSRGLIERLGKYNRFANLGFNWVIPLVENVYIVNITEQLVNAETQEIITNDNLNAKVDAQLLRRLETVEKALSQNSKIVVPINSELVNVIGDLAGGGIVPLKK